MSEPEQQPKVETEKHTEEQEDKGTITPALRNLFDELKQVSDGFLECLVPVTYKITVSQTSFFSHLSFS